MNRGRTIGDAFRSGSNSFDLIRLVAALMVLVSHSYPLAASPAGEPFQRYLKHDNGGSLAVAIFFVISGFLVTRSVLERETNRYVLARCARLLPALWVVTILEVTVVGMVCTTLPIGEYLQAHQTREHLYNVFVFPIRSVLPGVFADHPNRLVNGSMWTIPVEVACYRALPFLALAGALRKYVVLALPVIAFLALWYVVRDGHGSPKPGPYTIQGVPTYPGLRYIVFFVIGCAMWVHRDDIPLNGGMAFVCVAVLYAGTMGEAKPWLLYLTLPYLVMYAGLAHPVLTSLRESVGDLSYGVYLYAFPVQQMLVWRLGVGIGPVTLMLLAAPIALGLAFLSWHLVEARALEWFRRRNGGPQPARAAAPTPATEAGIALAD